MLQAASEAGVRRVVLTSSVACLGFPSPGKHIMDENDAFNLKPEDFPYGYSKHLAEQVMAEFVASGLDVVSVLPAAVIGPRDIKFVGGELIIQALKGFPAVPRGGLNYVDARDVAEGHIAAAERGSPGERYILAGHNMTHRETLQQVAKVLGTRVPRLELPGWAMPPTALLVSALQRLGVKMPIDRGRVLAAWQAMYYDSSKARRELGLEFRPFADSIRDAYRWYLEHGYLERRGIKPTRPIDS
jgi:dihydroflavonol-4-reductase